MWFYFAIANTQKIGAGSGNADRKVEDFLIVTKHVRAVAKENALLYFILQPALVEFREPNRMGGAQTLGCTPGTPPLKVFLVPEVSSGWREQVNFAVPGFFV